MQSIYRCTELQKARTNIEHHCRKIASTQQYSVCGNYQVPEPWRGNLKIAPLLFISSNPSLDPTDDSPWETDKNTDIDTYFNTGFDVSIFPKIKHPRSQIESRVAFWASILNRARELYSISNKYNYNCLIPGMHFAISEVVHCKSRSEFGVKEAVDLCVEKHLCTVLNNSNAVVICILGDVAKTAFLKHQSMVAQKCPTPIIISLPHPNARKPRKIKDAVMITTQYKITDIPVVLKNAIEQIADLKIAETAFE